MSICVLLLLHVILALQFLPFWCIELLFAPVPFKPKCEKQKTKKNEKNTRMYLWYGGLLVEFMYLVLTRMPGESYRRRLRS